MGLHTEGPNSAGAHLAGAVPHREPGGAAAPSPWAFGARHVVLAAEGHMSCSAASIRAMTSAAGRRRVGPRRSRCGRHHSPQRSFCGTSLHVVLPIGSFAESSGTYVNAEGRWQSLGGRRQAGRGTAAGLESIASPRESPRPTRRRLHQFPMRFATRSKRLCGDRLLLPAAGGGAGVGGDRGERRRGPG